ncbi:MAG TPA: DUF2798 domain-containing protein [Solimonas sp.]|nr:DUF2798 domain-containing protein [Solimonas sp.]
MKIPRRHAPRLFALFMAFSMSMLMSAVLTLVNLGPAGFPGPWLHAWTVAFIVALPLILLLAPLGQRFVAAITE